LTGACISDLSGAAAIDPSRGSAKAKSFSLALLDNPSPNPNLQCESGQGKDKIKPAMRLKDAGLEEAEQEHHEIGTSGRMGNGGGHLSQPLRGLVPRERTLDMPVGNCLSCAPNERTPGADLAYLTDLTRPSGRIRCGLTLCGTELPHPSHCMACPSDCCQRQVLTNPHPHRTTRDIDIDQHVDDEVLSFPECARGE
jgi:hypothetical protein